MPPKSSRIRCTSFRFHVFDDILQLTASCSFFCASCAARAGSATSMLRLVSITASLLYPLRPAGTLRGKSADCFIFRIKQEMLQLADPHMNLFTVLQVFGDERSFTCVPWRVRVFHLQLQILPSTSCTLSSCRISVWHPSFFEYQGAVFNTFSVLFRVHLFWSAAVQQLWPQATPSIARTLPAPHQGFAMWVYSPHHVMLSPNVLRSIFSACGWSSFASHLGPSHVPGSFLLVSAYATVVACSRTPLRTMLLGFRFLVHEDPVFFWLGCGFFRVLPFLHQTVKISCVLQCCVHLLPFFAGMWLPQFAPLLLRPSSLHPSLARQPSPCCA